MTKVSLELAKNYPGTFTSRFLCHAEHLSPETYLSLDAFRQNFLQREIFSNPLLYSSHVSWRALLIYTDLILDKTDPAFTGFEKVLSIAGKNPEAAKRLQQLLYNLFYQKRKETLLSAFIDWSLKYPDKMTNEVVKMKLDRLKPCRAGSSMLDIQLNDPGGNERKLSETVALAKLTLLIFYSPSCGHCQQQIPQFIPVWEQYKSKGLRFYLVSAEATADDWSRFIRNYSSTEWTHVIENAATNNYSIKYAVDSTPTLVLIDQQGKIITKMSTPEEVIEKIKKRLD